jgi:YidC/Oxa1 family membrane protein insertase
MTLCQIIWTGSPMDNFRLVLFFALAVVLLLIYQAWVADYGNLRNPPVAEATTSAVTPTSSAMPQVPNTSEAPAPVASGGTQQEEPAQTVTVDTDLLRVEVSARGGTIRSLWLKHYPVTPDQPDRLVRLFKPEPPNMFIAQSGLLSEARGELPTHEAIFATSQTSYTLAPNQDSLSVDLLWTNASGLQVKKRYVFTRGSYVVRVTQQVMNNSKSPVVVRSYTQLQRTELNDPNEPRFVHVYTGAVYYSPQDKYQRVSFKDIQKQRMEKLVSDGWIAMIQHYFMAAWIPPREAPATFYTSTVDASRFIIGLYSKPVTIAPDSSHAFDNRLFAGPKLQDTLASIAPGLDLTVDYGWLTVIAQPIYWLLEKIHSIVGNWGWAIIILTILIKAAFYKLSETSYKSMANMRRLTPRMQALKDRYGDDKQRLNQAMMELYKKEKINPLGGCLPIVVQIPVFISLYWVLLESVELRQAPFALWINNLSAPDPYFVLPLIMGVSMFIQQKLNPAPPDPIQAKVMMSLPFVFTVFFAFFPAGLVLYWVVNNVLSIAQQWNITRTIEQAAAKVRQ